jgi:hypothetical protein
MLGCITGEAEFLAAAVHLDPRAAYAAMALRRTPAAGRPVRFGDIATWGGGEILGRQKRVADNDAVEHYAPDGRERGKALTQPCVDDAPLPAKLDEDVNENECKVRGGRTDGCDRELDPAEWSGKARRGMEKLKFVRSAQPQCLVGQILPTDDGMVLQ